MAFFIFGTYFQKEVWKIKRQREKIDKLNSQILELINKRASIALKLARIKLNQGLGVYSPRREEEILTKMTKKNQGPLGNKAVKRIFKLIIEETRKLEQEVEKNGGNHET